MPNLRNKGLARINTKTIKLSKSNEIFSTIFHGFFILYISSQYEQIFKKSHL